MENVYTLAKPTGVTANWGGWNVLPQALKWKLTTSNAPSAMGRTTSTAKNAVFAVTGENVYLQFLKN